MQMIGIDIGTTSICGVVVDVQSGKLIASKTVDSNAFIDSKFTWEKIQSPEKIIAIATDILNEFICEETSSIGVTGQMHGIVYTDEVGNAVSPLYTWQDDRGNLPFKDTTYAKHIGSFSGYGNVTDFYNRENELIPKNAVSYCTIHDYFVMKLCGLTKPIIHSSDAASFGLYDLQNNKFNYDVNVEITTDFLIAGSYKSIPVSVAIGDNQASVFSTLANEDDVLLNVGTGSQVSIVTDRIITGEDIEIRPYFDNKYLVVGAALCGGRAYSLLKDFYAQILSTVADVTDSAVYEIMNKMLLGIESSSLTVDTRFAGTRKNTEIKGSIMGITTQNFNPAEITLAVLNGMVSELYLMYKQMDTKKAGIVGSGNGIRKNNNFVLLAEKSFNSKMKIPAHTEEAAFGAALFAGVSCGIFKKSSDAQKLIKYI